MSAEEDNRPVAIITGGAGAIASSIAARLSRDGWRMVLADIDEQRAAEVAGGIANSTHVRLDVTDEDSVEQAVTQVAERWGRLDGVVNNAGILPVGDLAATDPALWDRTMNINLRGAYLVTRAAMGHLLAAPAPRVVMIGSRTWLAGGNPAYTASKAAIIGLARSVANELGAAGGTCNVVAPGPVDTPLAPVGDEAFARWAEQTLLGRNCEPEDVARAVSFFMGPDSDFVTGEVLHVAGGLQMAVRL